MQIVQALRRACAMSAKDRQVVIHGAHVLAFAGPVATRVTLDEPAQTSLLLDRTALSCALKGLPAKTAATYTPTSIALYAGAARRTVSGCAAPEVAPWSPPDEWIAEGWGAVERVMFAASRDKSDRRGLSTVVFRERCVEAFDETCYARAALPGGAGQVVPLEGVQKFTGKAVEYAFDARSLWLRKGDELRRVDLLESPYPDLTSLHDPRSPAWWVRVDRSVLSSVVRQAASCARYVSVGIEAGQVVCAVVPESGGEALSFRGQATVQAACARAPEVMLMLDAKRLAAALDATSAELIDLRYIGADSPLLVRAGHEFYSVLWPLVPA